MNEMKANTTKGIRRWAHDELIDGFWVLAGQLLAGRGSEPEDD